MASDNTIVVGFETEGVQMTMDALKALRSQSEKMEKAETQAYIEQSKRNARVLEDIKKLQQAKQDDLNSAMDYANGIGTSSKNVGDILKSISKDISAIGGDGSSAFAKWGSDIVGVKEALGVGGLTAALSGVAFGVGVVIALYEQWQEEAKEAAKRAVEAAKAADDSAKAHKALVEEILSGLSEQRESLDEAWIEAQENRIEATKIALGEEYEAAEAQVQKVADLEEYSREDRVKAEAEFERVRARAREEFADMRVTQARIQEVREALELSRANEKTEKKTKEHNTKQIKQFDDTFEEIAKLRIAANKKAEAESKLHRERMAAIMFDDEYDKDLPLPPGLGLRPEEIKAQKERDDMLRKAGEDAERESERRADKLEREAAALKKKQEAEEQANNALIAHTASTIAYESAAMFVQPAISGLTNKIGELRDVNRENFQDFFDFSKMTPELIAAQVQAIAVGIAQQALGKAAMSGADAVKETALAIGDFAYGNAAGGTAHLKSAALHASAAVAYGAIAGGSAGVALGIGATRPATADERERDNRAGGSSPGRDGSGRASSGSTMGRGDGSGGGGFSVTVVQNAPLMISRESNRDAGRAVARALTSANRSAFVERAMRG